MTLLEVVLAMGLLVLLSSMTYWFYGSSLETRDAGIRATQRLQLTRVLLDRIATELRQVAANTSYRSVAIRGEPERIWIASLRAPKGHSSLQYLLKDEPPPPEFDLIKVEYKIARHPDIEHEDGYPMPLGLARVEIKVPRKDSAETGAAFEELGQEGMSTDETFISDALPDEGEEDLLFADELEDPDEPVFEDEIQWEELYAPEVCFLRFCYYDGNRWWDSWDVQGDNPLPQLIQVTVGYEPHPPFGDALISDEYEEFCTCMNDDPSDCEPLDDDQYTMVVRLVQADMFFTSRITRESQALLEEMGGEE